MLQQIQSQVGVASDKGPVRVANEDAYGLPQPGDPVQLGPLYVVADGVGGQEHGAAAATLAVQEVRTAYYRAREQGEAIPTALNRALHAANQAVYRESRARDGSRMGATVVAAVPFDDALHVAHVGDARAYLWHQGRLRQLTTDDTWVQQQVSAGHLTADQAARHAFRNVVTQVLGNRRDIEVHLSEPVGLGAGDVLLLCSDGLYDPVAEGEIAAILAARPAARAAAALVETAIRREATDNVTALVVQFGPVAAGWRRQLQRWLPPFLARYLSLG